MKENAICITLDRWQTQLVLLIQPFGEEKYALYKDLQCEFPKTFIC